MRVGANASPRPSLPVIWSRCAQHAQRHPFAAKTITSAIGFGFGDFLTQLSTRPKGQPLTARTYDYARTGKMAAVGLLLAGPIGLRFLQFLDKTIQPNQVKSKGALTAMVVLDQVLGCAIWQAALISIDQGYRKVVVQFCSSRPGQLTSSKKAASH